MSSKTLFFATGGYDHTIKLWNIINGTCIQTLQFTESQINDMDLTSDQLFLVAAGYRKIRIYDLQANLLNPMANYEGINKNVTSVGFVDSGKWMYSASEDGTVRIWDIRSRFPQCQKLFTTSSIINCAILHPNQHEIIFGDQNGVIHLWDLRTDRSEQLKVENEVSILDVDITNDGKMLAAVNNRGRSFIWNLRSSSDNDIFETERLIPRYKFQAHDTYALKCKFSPNSELLATSSADQSVRIWKLEDFSKLCELKQEHQMWVWDLDFSADSKRILSASSDGVAKLWNIENGTRERTYSGHQKSITSLVFRDTVLETC